MSTLYTFRLKGGKHSSPGPADKAKVVKKGKLIESEHRLDKIFNNKFDLVSINGKAVEQKAEAEVVENMDQPLAESVDTEAVTDDTVNYGDDLTDTFPLAKKNNVRVFQSVDTGFTILNEGNEVLNEEPLLKRPDVNKFLKTL